MIKLLSKSDFKKGQVTPYLVSKDFKKNPEGNFSIYFFSKTVMERDKTTNRFKKFYRYCQLRYESNPALFVKRKEAIQFARYRLGLD